LHNSPTVTQRRPWQPRKLEASRRCRRRVKRLDPAKRQQGTAAWAVREARRTRGRQRRRGTATRSTGAAEVTPTPGLLLRLATSLQYEHPSQTSQQQSCPFLPSIHVMCSGLYAREQAVCSRPLVKPAYFSVVLQFLIFGCAGDIAWYFLSLFSTWSPFVLDLVSHP
jgi:hypothetical protein